MSEPDAEKGFGEALEESEGHPAVVLAMNAGLSLAFGWLVVWGLAFIDLLEYSALNVATAAILLFALTYALVLR